MAAPKTSTVQAAPDKPKHERVMIRGNVMWAHLDKPNEMSGKYQVDICNLSKADVDKLEASGLEVKVGTEEKAEKGRYITPKAGRPVRIVDNNKAAWPNDKLIGNGSIVNALVKGYDWEFKGKTGLGCGLEAVQVLKHVNYDACDAFAVEEGFTAEPF